MPARFADRPVERPLLIFDGDCGFCRRTVERIKEITGDRADYVSSQEAGADFPSILPEEFAREVKLVETDGRVYGAAEAVLRLIFDAGKSPWSGLPLWAYRTVPGVRRVSESSYHFVATHRMLFSTLVRWLWGNELRRATFQTARTWFLRALGAVYFIAFLSLRVQVDGLIGKEGILPVAPLLGYVRAQKGVAWGVFHLPTLLWVTGGGDGALHFLCDGGMVLALLLIVGVAPPLCLALLWVSYLSLATAGQTFLGFQWDVLLLETGFLSLFLAPLRWWTGWRGAAGSGSRVALFLMRWLLFRFMLMSGVVKLTSGDLTWRNLTALQHHYETQPLPTWIGWWAHQAPGWWQACSLVFVFAVELVVPFFVWGPRRVRLAGFWLLVLLQALIALTGNYGFFNLLTAALCLLLLDDRQWPRWLANPAPGEGMPAPVRRWPSWVLAPVAVVYVVFGALLLWRSFFPAARWPGPLEDAYVRISPFRSLNDYGLFRTMTVERPEIVVEGSNDGENWRAYTFRWKAGDPSRAPRFVAPYMPRLDWQMWFAALDRDDALPWFEPLLLRLLQGSPAVLGLVENNPFPDAPPCAVRALLYEYRFTDPAERRRTGAWWRRELRGQYFPSVSRQDFRTSE